MRALLLTVLVLSPLVAGATPSKPPRDPIEGTRWIGTLTSPTEPSAIALEFERSPRGVLFVRVWLPRMHMYGKPASAVTVEGNEYVLDELHTRLRLEGDTLSGSALFAAMPVRLKRQSVLPPLTEREIPSLPPGPEPRWSRPLGAAAWGSPAVRDGTVYIGTADGRMHALRASDGGDVWTWNDSTPLFGDALVTEDAVFVVNERAELVRLDRARGSLVWRVALDPARRAPAPIPDDDTYSHRTPLPVLADGTLYVGSSDGSVRALDPASGAVRWRATVGAKVAAAVAVAGERLLVGAMDGSVVALARGDGRELWRKTLGAAVASAPVVAGDLAFVGGRDFLLHAYDVRNGREVWQANFWASWVESAPRVVGGVLYVGSSDLRAVRAIDPENGRVLWSSDVYGSAWGSPVVTDETVYMGVVGVKDYLIDHRPSIVALDRRNGDIRWRRSETPPADAPMSGHPGAVAIAGDTLFAAGIDGTLVALPTR